MPEKIERKPVTAAIIFGFGFAAGNALFHIGDNFVSFMVSFLTAWLT
jgi:hypothetical protein